MPHNHEQVRILTSDDIYAIERLLRNSEYIYQRFTLAELPLLLKRCPAVGLFHGSSLQGFLLSQTINAPSAWIGGFGVSWTESKAYIYILTQLLEHLRAPLIARGVRHLHYSGNDAEHDWLRDILLPRGFLPYRYLYAYDKFDTSVPTEGNQQVKLRPVNIGKAAGEPGDIPALLAIDEACFEILWRYDSNAFIDIATTHPYFVVAELDGKVIGYQFNALDADFGYLVRIAVHPSQGSHGIGARLMAEAIHFFQRMHTAHIMLNTQEDNYHAHHLYEWFGFTRIQQKGFVLRKNL